MAVLCGGAIVGATASADENPSDNVPAQGTLTPQAGDGVPSTEDTGSDKGMQSGEGTESGDNQNPSGATTPGDSSTSNDTSEGDNGSEPTNSSDNADVSAQADDEFFEDHVVRSDNPQGGTTVNMFDYWITKPDGLDYVNGDAGQGTTGINSNHQFMFGIGNGNGSIGSDGWPQIKTRANIYQALPRQGLVQKALVDGYPKLADSNGLTSNESLSYLFDDNGHEGKKSFMDVQGLLQVGAPNETDLDGSDLEGYYYYNSQRNFAHLDGNSRQIKLYDNKAVLASGNSPTGQFFPFNTASQVFKSEEQNGKLVSNEQIWSRCSSSYGANPTKSCKDSSGNTVNINHYFGVSMSTRFVQPDGGMVKKVDGTTTPMKYHFAGDDDVWVFIDDVLVGDLGGIHNRASLDIDFSEGAVSVKGLNGDGREETVQNTTLARLFGNSSSSGGFSGDTFANGTYHTLSFFYLERGNSDSNMELKFNLKTVPENNVVKVDQNGKPVANASFNLYGSKDGEKYDFKNEDNLIATGTTDGQGNLTLIHENQLVSFDDQYRKYDQKYFILEETSVPVGYRKPANDMWLRYVSAPAAVGQGEDTASGAILSVTDSSLDGSLWNTGSMAIGKVTTTASKEIKDIEGNNVNASQGVMFAVVVKRQKTENGSLEDDKWYGVSGDPLSGWKLSPDDSMQGIVEAFKANSYANVFELTSAGGYEVTVDDLPGDIEQYYYMLDEKHKEDAQYSIGYYYSATATRPEDVTAKNTVRLNSDAFTRLFAANFYISNIKNQLYVQKVDELGNPVNGAKFGLYNATDVDTTTNTLNNNAQPFDTLTTENLIPKDGLPDFDGAGVFPDTSDKKALLGPTGNAESVTYYLGEIEAPAGYVKSSKLTKVTVNQYGVFADAGGKDDGIKVVRGAGYMLKSVATLGASPKIDDTLTWIKLTPKKLNETGTAEVDAGDDTKSGRVVEGKIVPSDTVSNPLRLDYSADVTALEYGPRSKDGDLLYITDVGTPTVFSQQDCAPTGGEVIGSCDQAVPNETGVTRTDLGDLRLNALISGTVMVQVTNNRAGAHAVIKLNKKVDGADWDSQDGTVNFGFTLERTDNPVLDNANDKVTYETKDESGTVTQHVVGSVTSSTTEDIENGRQQTVEFPELTFHSTGEYTFSLKENAEEPADGWTYDTKTFTVTVNVQQAADGTMTATVSYLDLASDETLPLFVNMKYGPALPETGGAGVMSMIWGGLLLIGCSLTGLAYVRKRR